MCSSDLVEEFIGRAGSPFGKPSQPLKTALGVVAAGGQSQRVGPCAGDLLGPGSGPQFRQHLTAAVEFRHRPLAFDLEESAKQFSDGLAGVDMVALEDRQLDDPAIDRAANIADPNRNDRADERLGRGDFPLFCPRDDDRNGPRRSRLGRRRAGVERPQSRQNGGGESRRMGAAADHGAVIPSPDGRFPAAVFQPLDGPGSLR